MSQYKLGKREAMNTEKGKRGERREVHRYKEKGETEAEVTTG